MKKLSKKFALAAIALSVLSTSCQDGEENVARPSVVQEAEVVKTAPNHGEIIPGKYIVVFNDGSIDNASFRTIDDYEARTKAMKKVVANAFSKYGVTEDKIEHAYSSTISGIALSLDAANIERLSKDSRVSYIEPDRVVALGTFSSTPTTQSTTLSGDEVPWGIARVNGGQPYTGNKKCYIIDTGIQLNHPDLNVRQTGFNAFTSGPDARSLNDGNGHGTHCAGTVAARANGTGVVGVAAGALVVPVKVLDSRGSGSNSGVIAGIDYVGANAAVGDVANMSLGGSASTAIDNAVIRAASRGIIFCIAAGNESQNANNVSPARVNGTNIFTVSAMDINGRFASFSNFANPPIDVCQPGVSIKSTWINSSYNTISGTSMATPHFAGLKLWGTTLRLSGYVTGDRDSTPDPIYVK